MKVPAIAPVPVIVGDVKVLFVNVCVAANWTILLLVIEAIFVAVSELPVRLAVTPPEAVIELSFKTTPSTVTPEPVVSSLIVSTFNPSSARIGPLNVVVFPVEPTETNPVIVVILAWAAVVKVPDILPKVTLSVVPTAWPMEISPPAIPTPVPALKCALVSAAEGPV